MLRLLLSPSNRDATAGAVERVPDGWFGEAAAIGGEAEFEKVAVGWRGAEGEFGKAAVGFAILAASAPPLAGSCLPCSYVCLSI